MNKTEQTTSEYNGWKNYETWNAVLWAMNEEASYRVIVENRPYTAEHARDIFMRIYPHGTPDMESAEDLLPVDWAEVAQGFNEEKIT